MAEQDLGSMVQLPVSVEQITKDVRKGIMAQSGIAAGRLIEQFIQGLKEQFIVTKQQFYSGGEYCDVLDVIEGDGFSRRPLKARLEAIVQFASLTEEQKSRLQSQRMVEIYNAYAATDSRNHTDSQRAWARFVDAWKKLKVSHYIDEDKFSCDSYFYWHDIPNVYLHTPSLIDGCPKPFADSKGEMLTNTEMQTKMARQMGILQPEETWLQFIARDAIKLVPRSQIDRESVVPKVVVGRVQEAGNNFAGIATEYENVPTKYPDIQALVIFDEHSYGYRAWGEKLELDSLITKGILSPKMALAVPVGDFLGVKPSN